MNNVALTKLLTNACLLKVLSYASQKKKEETCKFMYC